MKQIHQEDVFNFNHCFHLKYKSSIYNIAYSSEKIASSESVCIDQAQIISKNSS